MTGIDLIRIERDRQVREERYDAEHDDYHVDGEIALAAIAYLMKSVPDERVQQTASIYWPWGLAQFKSRSKKENLVRAGALIAAELDRIARLEMRDG